MSYIQKQYITHYQKIARNSIAQLTRSLNIILHFAHVLFIFVLCTFSLMSANRHSRNFTTFCTNSKAAVPISSKRPGVAAGGRPGFGAPPPASTCGTCGNRADPATLSGWWWWVPRLFGPPTQNLWRRR